jgi:hypothetical protein
MKMTKRVEAMALTMVENAGIESNEWRAVELHITVRLEKGDDWDPEETPVISATYDVMGEDPEESIVSMQMVGPLCEN